MIVYHGSNSCFKKLRLGKDLIKKESTKSNEGMGIYFSTDIETAKGYGKFLYTLEINEDYFTDFRKRNNCLLYVESLANGIKKELGIDIRDYINIQDIADRMYWGGQCISGVGREVFMLLDSVEEFYSIPKSKIDKLCQILRRWDRNQLKAYMFNYSIANIGVIKDVSEDVVKIVKREMPIRGSRVY